MHIFISPYTDLCPVVHWKVPRCTFSIVHTFSFRSVFSQNLQIYICSTWNKMISISRKKNVTETIWDKIRLLLMEVVDPLWKVSEADATLAPLIPLSLWKFHLCCCERMRFGILLIRFFFSKALLAEPRFNLLVPLVPVVQFHQIRSSLYWGTNLNK